MKNSKAFLLAGLSLLAISCADVKAQSITSLCVRGNSGNCIPVNAGAPLPVDATVNASISGFTPNGNVANLSVTDSSGNVALPAGVTIAVNNTGSKAAHIKLSIGSGTAATTDFVLTAGATQGLTVGSNTFINAIAETGETTTLSIAGGSGLVSGFGGGSGGGSGGDVNITEINGTTALANTGTTGAGSLRTTVARDTTTIAGAAPGTAGTASANVLTVQGIASATPVIVGDGSGALNVIVDSSALPSGASTSALQPTNSAQGATTSGQTGPLIQAAVTTSAPSYTNAQTSPLNMTTGGSLRVTCTSGCSGSGGTSSNYDATFPTAGTAVGASDGTNMKPLKVDSSGNLLVAGVGVAAASSTASATFSPTSYNAATACNAKSYTNAQQQPADIDLKGNQCINVASIAGTAVSTGTGAQGAGAQRVTVATDTATVAGSAPGTAGTASANVVTVQGVASMTPVQVSQATASNLNATIVGTGTLGVQNTASATGGATQFTLTAANSTNATNIKASAGKVYHISVYNNSATLAWVSFYNNAGTPTCGTGIVHQTMIPANSTSGAGAVEDFVVGKDFSTGIAMCVTTGIAGTGSVAASAYVINVDYK